MNVRHERVQRKRRLLALLVFKLFVMALIITLTFVICWLDIFPSPLHYDFFGRIFLELNTLVAAGHVRDSSPRTKIPWGSFTLHASLNSNEKEDDSLEEAKIETRHRSVTRVKLTLIWWQVDRVIYPPPSTFSIQSFKYDSFHHVNNALSKQFD